MKLPNVGHTGTILRRQEVPKVVRLTKTAARHRLHAAVIPAEVLHALHVRRQVELHPVRAVETVAPEDKSSNDCGITKNRNI